MVELLAYDDTNNRFVLLRATNVATDSTNNKIYGDVAMSADTLPLPSGAATAARQDTLNATIKAENASFTQGDSGIIQLPAVRNDGFTSLTSADGRYSPLMVDQYGRLISRLGGFSELATGTELTTALGLKVAETSQYPYGANPLQASSGNVANAQAVATLDVGAGETAYISGFDITGSGATLGLPVTVTITGLLGGTRSYTYSAAAGVLLENTPLIVSFVPALKASATNTDIVVTCPALGGGNTNNVANAQGYKL